MRDLQKKLGFCPTRETTYPKVGTTKTLKRLITNTKHKLLKYILLFGIFHKKVEIESDCLVETKLFSADPFGGGSPKPKAAENRTRDMLYCRNREK